MTGQIKFLCTVVALAVISNCLGMPEKNIFSGKSDAVLWNDKCPHSFGKTAEEGELLKKEIPDFRRDYRFQMEWKGGRVIKDPNRVTAKEVALTQKAVFEIFKPGVVPLRSIDGNILLLPDVEFKGGKKNALVFRFKKGKYIIKIMKTFGGENEIFVTVRDVSKKPADIIKLSEDIFNDRVLPVKWDRPFHIGNLKRKSKTVNAGQWLARDSWGVNESGHLTKIYKYPGPIERRGTIGVGPYEITDFCTNGKFASFEITAGEGLVPVGSIRQRDLEFIKNFDEMWQRFGAQGTWPGIKDARKVAELLMKYKPSREEVLDLFGQPAINVQRYQRYFNYVLSDSESLKIYFDKHGKVVQVDGMGIKLDKSKGSRELIK